MDIDDCEAGPSKRPNDGLRLPKLPSPLTYLDKEYFLAVERGSVSAVRSLLEDNISSSSINIDCVDSLGRSTVQIAIENENLEMVQLLVQAGVAIKDALLHAIDKEFVECVEFLLEHEEKIHQEGELYSWEKVDKDTATFTPEITPLILAGHRDSYEILKILLDHGATLPIPHGLRCPCEDCIVSSQEDSLRYSRRRFNIYRALTSPSLIALSSTDPILTAFELCFELKNLSLAENEYKEDYLKLRKKCQDFAVEVLAQARSSTELELLLNYDPSLPPHQLGTSMSLARLKVAIDYDQKTFVAHPSVQQLLSSLWYEGLPGFRRKNLLKQLLEVVKVVVLFPFYSTVYILAPRSKMGKLMRKPFMKFLVHSASYLFFLFLLILASQRVEAIIAEFLQSKGLISAKQEEIIITAHSTQRGNYPALVEWIIFSYVLGFIWQETKELTRTGFKMYIMDMWNSIDFIRNILYVTTIGLRFFSFMQARLEIANNPTAAFIPREHWQAFDPMLVAEGLFAAANIFSALKLLHMFSINPYLGPLQISVGRMAIDIIKFFFIYSLVLFSFACGLNQLLWYYSNLEKQRCFTLPGGVADWKSNSDSCMIWRRFFNLFESSQSLFWASFGMIDLRNFELTGIQSYTRFWAMLMFGSYCVINVIVLLNLLIAMMSNSYNDISARADMEWKFARTKLWLSYFDEGSTLPSPFNVIPSPKSILRCFGCCRKDKNVKENFEDRDSQQYEAVMQSLVWRYVTAQQRKTESTAVTEENINEVKKDISAFRYELLNILYKNGMAIADHAVISRARPSSGRKARVWERRLLKDFSITPVESCALERTPEGAEEALTTFQKLVRVEPDEKRATRMWKDVLSAAIKSSSILNNKERKISEEEEVMNTTEEKNTEPQMITTVASVVEIQCENTQSTNPTNSESQTNSEKDSECEQSKIPLNTSVLQDELNITKVILEESEPNTNVEAVSKDPYANGIHYNDIDMLTDDANDVAIQHHVTDDANAIVLQHHVTDDANDVAIQHHVTDDANAIAIQHHVTDDANAIVIQHDITDDSSPLIPSNVTDDDDDLVGGGHVNEIFTSITDEEVEDGQYYAKIITEPNTSSTLEPPLSDMSASVQNVKAFNRQGNIGWL